MPFSLCVKCFEKVDKSTIYEGTGFFRIRALPKPMQYPELSAWLDPAVLCALLCVKHVSQRREIPLPKGMTPATLRSLGLLIQQYPYGFQIPKTPEMLMLLKFSVSEAYNINALRYFPPKLTNSAAKVLLRGVDEKGCEIADPTTCAFPLLIQRVSVPRMYPFEPAYYTYKDHSGKTYLMSRAYARLAHLIHTTGNSERTITFHVIVEEASPGPEGVAMTTAWRPFKRKETFMAKCAADECEQLCANDYPLCEKCSPLCSAPFCTQRMVSTADNMCSECGGAFEAQITVTNAHVCTYEMLESEGKENCCEGKGCSQAVPAKGGLPRSESLGQGVRRSACETANRVFCRNPWLRFDKGQSSAKHVECFFCEQRWR